MTRGVKYPEIQQKKQRSRRTSHFETHLMSKGGMNEQMNEWLNEQMIIRSINEHLISYLTCFYSCYIEMIQKNVITGWIYVYIYVTMWSGGTNRHDEDVPSPLRPPQDDKLYFPYIFKYEFLHRLWRWALNTSHRVWWRLFFLLLLHLHNKNYFQSRLV